MVPYRVSCGNWPKDPELLTERMLDDIMIVGYEVLTTKGSIGHTLELPMIGMSLYLSTRMKLNVHAAASSCILQLLALMYYPWIHFHCPRLQAVARKRILWINQSLMCMYKNITPEKKFQEDVSAKGNHIIRRKYIYLDHIMVQFDLLECVLCIPFSRFTLSLFKQQ